MAKKPRPGQEAKSPIYKRLWFAIAVAVGAGLLTLTVIGWLWGEGGIFSLRRIFSFWVLDLHATDKAEYIKSALALVGGIGGVVYLVVKYRERAAAERDEARADRKEAEERLLAAVQQLGSESPQVRIAGVYALADVADTYLGDYKQRVVNILCGYLRTKRGKFVERKPEKDMVENADVKTGGAEAPRVYESDDGPVESTILEVFASHLRKQDPADTKASTAEATPSWSECKFDLHGACFIEPLIFKYRIFIGDITFKECHFAREVNCSGSTFTGGASFAGSTFTGRASFVGSTFTGRASFVGSTFKGWASFDGSTFNDWASFYSSAFTSRASFDHSTFNGGASFVGSTFAREAHNAYQKWFGRSPFGSLPLEENGLPKGARWDDEPVPSDEETELEDSPPDGDTALPDVH